MNCFKPGDKVKFIQDDSPYSTYEKSSANFIFNYVKFTGDPEDNEVRSCLLECPIEFNASYVWNVTEKDLSRFNLDKTSLNKRMMYGNDFNLELCDLNEK